MNDATHTPIPAWLNVDKIVTPKTRAAMDATETLAWELLPRMIELSYVAGKAHSGFASDTRDTSGPTDARWDVLSHYSGFDRVRDVLLLVSEFAGHAEEGRTKLDGYHEQLIDRYSGEDSPVDVAAVMDEWRERVDSDDWPAS